MVSWHPSKHHLWGSGAKLCLIVEAPQQLVGAADECDQLLGASDAGELCTSSSSVSMTCSTFAGSVPMSVSPAVGFD